MNAQEAAAYVDREIANRGVKVTPDERARLIWAAAGGRGAGAGLGPDVGSDGGVGAWLVGRAYEQGAPSSSGARIRRNQDATAPVQPSGATAVVQAPNEATAASIKTVLTQLDLTELLPLVDQWVRGGVTSFAEVEMQLMDRNSEAGKVVQRKYGVFFDLMDQGRYQSIGAIRAYRQNAKTLAQSAGVADTAYFRDINAVADRWLKNDASLTEQASRLDLMREDVATALSSDPEALAELEAWQRFHGVTVTADDLLAAAFDDDVNLNTLERRVKSVRLDRSAGRAGFGDLSRQEAERIADLGADPLQATETFAALANVQREPLVGQRGETLSRDDLIEGGFGGNAFARRRIERKQRQQTAAFGGGGGFSASREGFALGSST